MRHPVVLGDFNAASSCDRDNHETALGSLGSRADSSSESSLLLWALLSPETKGYWLIVPAIQPSKLGSEAGNVAKEMDHILQNCKVYQSAKCSGSDHEIPVAAFRVHC